MLLKIKDTEYEFKATVGFLRELNERIKADVEGLKGVKRNVGFRFMLGLLYEGDTDALADVLALANKRCEPSIKRSEIEEYIADDKTDIDDLFEKVFDFLETSNVTKKITLDWKKDVEEEKAKAKANG
jgi:hypothetical protein